MATKVYSMPKFGLNGSNPEHVKDEFYEAWKKLTEARESLRVCTVNGRDYSPEEFSEAVFQKAEALASLEDSIHYVEQVLMHITDYLEDPTGARRYL